MVQMMTREECLAKARECEELSARLSFDNGSEALLEAATLWRRLATGELRPRTKTLEPRSSDAPEELASADEQRDRHIDATGSAVS